MENDDKNVNDDLGPKFSRPISYLLACSIGGAPLTPALAKIQPALLETKRKTGTWRRLAG